MISNNKGNIINIFIKVYVCMCKYIYIYIDIDIDIRIYVYVYIYNISYPPTPAWPWPRWGGAWDHRRCATLAAASPVRAFAAELRCSFSPLPRAARLLQAPKTSFL